jgi:uncharacterized phage infection (PIP) family protein YhgE
MIESYQQVKELQLAIKNINDRVDLVRQEIQFVRKEGVEENNKTNTAFSLKLNKDIARLNDQLADTRGEINESIKQRKRERADLMNEMSNIAERIDKGRE